MAGSYVCEQKMLYNLQSLRYSKLVNEDTWCTVNAYVLRTRHITAGASTRQQEAQQDRVCDGDRLLKPLEWYTNNPEMQAIFDRRRAAIWYG